MALKAVAWIIASYVIGSIPFGLIVSKLLFKQDLEQCADWAYRLWFEYQKEVGYGFDMWLLDYNGNKVTYRQWREDKSEKQRRYGKFFRWACGVSNSYSQKKGLYEVESGEDLRPGDLLVQNRDGGIGHTSIVFDVCTNDKGKRLYLMGYSFMPAQELHLEKAPGEYGEGGWFTLKGYYRYIREFMPYGTPVLRSFIRQDDLKLGDDPIENWSIYEKAVGKSEIPIEKAVLLAPEIVAGLDEYAERYEFRKVEKWVFPVKGYSARDMGGWKGNGYREDIYYGGSTIRGFSFFDGNRHGGHPAHDIFIRDRDRDCRDDRTKKPVDAVAMMDGIVLSLRKGWKPDSPQRGGNYVNLYHPAEGYISYYAHLDEVTVEPGQFVRAGEKVGTVGRSGRNSQPRRSPTHLHLMLMDRDLKPFNYFDKLK